MIMEFLSWFTLICLAVNAKAQNINLPIDDIPLDVYFLADNTGSMFQEIKTVREQARYIFDNIAARASENVRFGVGAYKDFQDNFVFRNLLSLTKENVNVPIEQDPIIKAMGKWEAQGGGDKKEAQLYAMAKIAGEQFEEIGWRSDSVKLLVWFGDAPGKDPANRINRKAVTETYVVELLVKADIRVIALDVDKLNETGQAKRIASATGGNYRFISRDRSQFPKPTPTPTPSPIPIPSPFPCLDLRRCITLPSPSPRPVPCRDFYEPCFYEPIALPYKDIILPKSPPSSGVIDTVNSIDKLTSAITDEVTGVFNAAVASKP